MISKMSGIYFLIRCLFIFPVFLVLSWQSDSHHNTINTGKWEYEKFCLTNSLGSCIVAIKNLIRNQYLESYKIINTLLILKSKTKSIIQTTVQMGC